MHIERQIIEFSFVGSYNIQYELVERDKFINEVPYLLIVRMENVRTVLMDNNPVTILTIHIATNVLAPVYN